MCHSDVVNQVLYVCNCIQNSVDIFHVLQINIVIIRQLEKINVPHINFSLLIKIVDK